MKKSIAVAAVIAGAFSATVTAAEKFTDPLRNLSFIAPAGKWQIAEGFGDNIATLGNSKDERISVKWIRGKNEAPSRETLMNLAGAHFKGAGIISVDDFSVSAEFIEHSGGKAFKGEMKILPADEGSFVVSCAAPAENYLDFHFTCGNFVAGIDTAKRDASLGEMAARAAARARFAILDGRSGCPEIAYEAEKVAQMAADADNKDAEKYFKGLAAALNKENKSELEHFIGNKGAGLFTKLAVARLKLEEGDADEALKYLKDADSVSQLAAALKIWAAGLKGDIRAQKAIAAEKEDNFCGESGALALYHLGLSEADPKIAERKFLEAIEADPLFKLPYIKLIEIAAIK